MEEKTTFEKLLDGKFYPFLENRTFPVQLYPSISDRGAWEKAVSSPECRRLAGTVMRKADELLNEPRPALSFMDLTAYLRDGNRNRYESGYFNRRNILGALAFATGLSGNAEKYLPRIMELLWDILQERYWCIPAHAAYSDGDFFPNDAGTQNKIDLFAAATGSALALVMNICGKEIRKQYPGLADLVNTECQKRLLRPLLEYSMEMHVKQRGHWWVAGSNNWATWIASNLLITAAVFAENGDQFFDALGKLLRIQGLYFDRRPEDGYCDEGPIYWTKAGGELVLFFHNLERLFPGSTKDILSLPKFANIAEFPARTAYTEEYSVNFSDAGPRVTYHPALLFIAGELGASPLMKALAEQRFDGWLSMLEECQWHSQLPSNGEFIRDLCLLFFDLPEEARLSGEFEPLETVFFPGRLGIIRIKGSFIASLKGGNNSESHNHNDLGHFTLFRESRPLVIDLGTDTYTAKTFSGHRYESVFHNAHGHNGPVFGGVIQQYGNEYTASLELKKNTPEKKTLFTDLSQSYPPEARAQNVSRTLTLTGDSCVVSDRCGEANRPIVITLFTPEEAIKEEQHIRFGHEAVLETANFAEVKVELFPCSDPLIVKNWGNCLRKIVLVSEKPDYDLIFRLL